MIIAIIELVFVIAILIIICRHKKPLDFTDSGLEVKSPFEGFIDISLIDHDSIKQFQTKYPTFNLSNFESKVKTEFYKMFTCLISKDYPALSAVCTKTFIESKLYKKIYYSNVVVSGISNSCNISWIGYNKDKDSLLLYVNSKHKVKDVNTKTGETYTGMTHVVNQNYYLVLKHSPLSSNPDVHCKKCGAPLKNVSSKKCAFCGAENEAAYEWLIDDISYNT